MCCRKSNYFRGFFFCLFFEWNVRSKNSQCIIITTATFTCTFPVTILIDLISVLNWHLFLLTLQSNLTWSLWRLEKKNFILWAFILLLKLNNVYVYLYSYCTNSQVQCTNNLCSEVCMTYGAPHYQTFDGKIFDFDGMRIKLLELSVTHCRHK